MRQQFRTAVMAALLGLVCVGAYCGLLAFDGDATRTTQIVSPMPTAQDRAGLASRMAPGQSDISVREACGVQSDVSIRDRCTQVMTMAASGQPRGPVASRVRTFIASFFTLKI